MVKVCGKVIENRKARLKRGFGIVEVLIAAVVLGFLYMAVMNLQSGNHDALLRIRGRDGATEVAQNMIESLGAQGLSSYTDASTKLLKTASNVLYVKEFPVGKMLNDTITVVTRTWEGQPGIITNTMKVDYEVVVKVSPDADFTTETTTKFLTTDVIKHVYAKRLDVTVRWCFKCQDPSNPKDPTKQSITVSGVIR